MRALSAAYVDCLNKGELHNLKLYEYVKNQKKKIYF